MISSQLHGKLSTPDILTKDSVMECLSVQIFCLLKTKRDVQRPCTKEKKKKAHGITVEHNCFVDIEGLSGFFKERLNFSIPALTL